jgi:hypothetical protein
MSEWALAEARADAAGFSLQAHIRDSISLAQVPVKLRPRTTYVVRFEARAEVALDRPLVVDLYGGPGYDSSEQDRVLNAIPTLFRPQSVLIDSGPNPPAEAVLRMYTQSMATIQIRNVSIAELGAIQASPFQELGTTKDGISVFLNQASLPRFRFARRLAPVRDLDEAHAAFRALEFDAANAVTVEGLSGEQTVESGQIVSQTIGNTRMQWRLRTPAKSFFVVADSWFPGWSATVDGRATHIYPVNGFLRGIFVEGAGDHEVAMLFRPVNLYVGLLGTAVGMAVLGVLWLKRFPRPLKSDRTSPESAPE